MSKYVCVIGAGPSGITAAKSLLDEGLTAYAKILESNVMPKFSHSLKEMKAHDLMKWRVI